MTDAEATRLREGYLARLDEAMHTLPHGVAGDIRQGIAEELAALDAEATAARIAQLGDPAEIAREAQNEVPRSAMGEAPPASATTATPAPSGTATRGFAITAALVLGFGGIVVPGVGWAVGAVLVCLSPLWKAWEKTVAILLPLAIIAVTWIIASSMTFTTGSSSGSSSGTGASPDPAVNPLVPDLFAGGAHLLILVAVLLVPASGLWLLWRLRGRGGR